MHAALRFCEEKVSGEELFKLINQVRWVADESGEHAKKAVGREPGQPGSERRAAQPRKANMFERLMKMGRGKGAVVK